MGEHSKRKHSNFSASASHRWMNCPASVELSKKAPPQIESKFAKEGTTAHECLEFVVKRYGNLAGALAAARKNPKWTEEMVLHAEASAKTIFKLKPSKTAKLYVETRVVLKHVSSGMYGTLDYAWVDEWGELTVIDYKYGAGVPVLPIDDETKEPNSQLMYYASGIAAKFDYEFSHIKLAIIQPRVWAEGEDPLTEGTVTIKQLRDFERRLKAAVSEAKKPNLTPVASPPEAADNWCRWCPAASFCPAVSKMQMDKAGIAFDVETGLDPQAMPVVEALNEFTIGKVLEACDHLTPWIASVRKQAFLLAVQGKKIEGRKFIEKRSNRFWKETAQAAAKKLFGEEAFVKELLSPAQLEKKFLKPGKTFAASHADKKSTGVRLVPSSHKAPEVSTLSEFESFEDSDDSEF